MKNNLFRNIWMKNLKKGERASKLADDVGPLKGFVTVKQYDPITGLVLAESKKQNAIVNQSKSTIIRLISQGQSFWTDKPFDPTDLKISRMRFGTHNLNLAQQSKLLYYDLTESSKRSNIPFVANGSNAYPGGNGNYTRYVDETIFSSSPVGNDAVNYTYLDDNLANIRYKTYYTFDKGRIVPPSHNTFVVELLNTSGNVIERISFKNESTSPDDFIYTRKSSGITPYKIEVVNPVSGSGITDIGSTLSSGSSIIITSNEQTGTRLYFDYSTKTWRVLLAEKKDKQASYASIRYQWMPGLFNIINSIVPKTGYNNFSGNTLATRYSSLGENVANISDYYNVLSDMEYRDGADDYVDDYSVTFSVNMGGSFGNGSTGNNPGSNVVSYSEAFLFNGRDEMFSAISLTPFSKNNQFAYYISWSILAPLQ